LLKLDFLGPLLCCEDFIKLLFVHILHAAVKPQHDNTIADYRRAVIVPAVSEYFIIGRVKVNPSGPVSQISHADMSVKLLPYSLYVRFGRDAAVIISVLPHNLR